MRKVLTTFALTAIVVMAAAASAKAFGTASDTVISNFATMTASGISTVTSNTVNTSVQDVYGLASWNETNAADKSVPAGSFATYVISVVNYGNTTDLIGVSVGAQAFNGSPGTLVDWSVAADDQDPFAAGLTWDISTRATASQLGDRATAVALISPGAAATFTIKVIVAGDAADSATMAFTLAVQNDGSPFGVYTGLDDAVTSYGGPHSYIRTVGSQGAATVTTTVTGVVLSLTKAVTNIFAPAAYTGGANDPVPGAQIDYTISYSNTGLGAASAVVIRDYIPTNTTYIAGTIVTTGVDITGGAGPKTDGADGDGCDWNTTVAGAVTCTAPTIPSLNSGTVFYSVSID